MKTWQGNFLTGLLKSGILKWRVSVFLCVLDSKTPSRTFGMIGSGFPPDYHSCYLTFYARQEIESELRFLGLARNLYIELTLMLFQSLWCADLWRVSKCLFLLISSTAQWDRTFINKAMQRATSFFERTTIELQQFSIQHTSSFGFAMFYERVCFTTVEFFVQLISRYHK